MGGSMRIQTHHCTCGRNVAACDVKPGEPPRCATCAARDRRFDDVIRAKFDPRHTGQLFEERR